MAWPQRRVSYSPCPLTFNHLRSSSSLRSDQTVDSSSGERRPPSSSSSVESIWTMVPVGTGTRGGGRGNGSYLIGSKEQQNITDCLLLYVQAGKWYRGVLEAAERFMPRMRHS